MYLGHSPIVKLENCKFLNNVAKEQTNAGGGALFVRDSNTSILKAIFIKNVAHGKYGSGGAVYLSQGEKHELTDISFQENSADYLGGAIYSLYRFSSDDPKSRMLLELRVSVFEENESGLGGGAIFVDKGVDARFWDCRLKNNRAPTKANSDAEYAGGSAIGSMIDWTEERSEVKIRSSEVPNGSVRLQGNVNYLGDDKYLQQPLETAPQ